ncbi:MAG: 3-methyladenine DNA glycosylase [Micrococcaceae bacterium]|nr:3-methyladenine DNA glycosylase [Micrococcaceae bacterium]MDN6177301.1 3-methyladenine DNA glycosylase [Micrococcaceae bacterium]
MPADLPHLTEDLWLPRARAHRDRVQHFAAPFLQRRSTQRKHPVEDFLFTYYTEKPGRLQRWNPGTGVVLLGDQAAERLTWRHHRPHGEGVTFDAAAFMAERHRTVTHARSILAGAASNPARFSCFGLHEWAMAYKSEENGVRHDYLPLRLGAAGTDEVVEGHRIRCTHIDAFRFYTPQAVGLNEERPTRENQASLDQPGCLHANMDLYKWAYKLSAAVPGELLLATFELAWDIRTMDIRASPYELGDWGYTPIRIETAAGKAEYVRLQQGFAEQATGLRLRLLAVADDLIAAAETEPVPTPGR